MVYILKQQLFFFINFLSIFLLYLASNNNGLSCVKIPFNQPPEGSFVHVYRLMNNLTIEMKYSEELICKAHPI